MLKSLKLYYDSENSASTELLTYALRDYQGSETTARFCLEKFKVIESNFTYLYLTHNQSSHVEQHRLFMEGHIKGGW